MAGLPRLLARFGVWEITVPVQVRWIQCRNLVYIGGLELGFLGGATDVIRVRDGCSASLCSVPNALWRFWSVGFWFAVYNRLVLCTVQTAVVVQNDSIPQRRPV